MPSPSTATELARVSRPRQAPAASAPVKGADHNETAKEPDGRGGRHSATGSAAEAEGQRGVHHAARTTLPAPGERVRRGAAGRTPRPALRAGTARRTTTARRPRRLGVRVPHRIHRRSVPGGSRESTEPPR